MKRCVALGSLFGLLLAGWWMPLRAAQSGQPAWELRQGPGPYEVQEVTYDWTDAARNRQVPVKIYFPKTSDGPLPVVIFSHGLGGSRDGYQYLGRCWASHGYVSVHVQHMGSDSEVWKGIGADRPQEILESLRRAAADPRNAIDRPRDISFAIDQMARMNRDDTPLGGRLDLDRVGVAGHSFGGYTTLAAAGEVFVGPLGGEWSLADPRVKAAIAMSAPAPRRRDKLDQAFARFRVPCFHMTGTLDDSPIGDTKAAERRIAFDHIRGADQYLLILAGGDHMVFSGRGRLGGSGEKDALFRGIIEQASTAFWDAYLKGNSQAKAWLAEGGFQTFLGENGTFEKRLISPAGTSAPAAR